ncbi:MAG TPA: UbiA family prenyltransferase [Methanotrichaceae archaeon]|nr:MAG: Digeranylgeranylglyceryl phosphate synthase [Methanosaeta sp. PtaU1.Bin028]HOT07631.1 UbiA family prenyltransferase [Methanotrichaceae archaeon]HQF15679.1 UbiA family prenyltransferase [Methanotrichaceae archaeon]HQI90415.1 UbiA family prenyltransferase [Methanotrichaceae archaeon]HQJ28979.1 UbiA family prenyltransferase [Methanotrichaceae archaeon]
MTDPRAYWELLRPPLAPMDLAMPGASALLAAYATSGHLPPAWPFAIATLGAYAAITSSYVLNDYVDVDVDTVAMPGRPLPSARVTRRAAGAYALLLFLLAAAVALYLNPESAVALAAATIIITIYSVWAKRNTPWSWILVGLAFGLVPVGVWLAMAPAGVLKDGPGWHNGALILGSMICITDWGFTNCDASRDLAGDRKKGVPTTPATYGVQFTSRLVFFFWAVGIAMSLALATSTGLGWIYMAAAIAAGSWMLVQSWDFLRNPSPGRGERLFYQGANYRAVLFVFLIADILFFATVI